MRRRIVFALLAISLTASPLPAADPLPRGQPSPADGIWFRHDDSVRLLQEVEQCRIISEEVVEREKIEQFLRKEIKERDERAKECQRAIEDAKRGGSAWDKIKGAGKWVIVGIVVGYGFAAGAGR